MSDSAKFEYRARTTLEEIRASKPQAVYYGANTCWWTTDPAHLYRLHSGIPCDPRGGVLFESHNVELFLSNAESYPGFYGRHGLRAFEAAYHGNVVVRETGLPTCFQTWDEYNEVIDAAAQPAGE